jgi:excisionase family DNA binding protein
MSEAADHRVAPEGRRPVAGGDRHERIGLSEAAVRYRLSRDTLARAARDGNLETRRTGKLWLTTPAAVEAYLRSARHRPGRKPQRRLPETPPPTGSATSIAPAESVA